MAWADYRHRVPLRVRWAEVDMQGIVFNGHYLTYCDVCITEYWRAIGMRYPDQFLAEGCDTFVRRASLEYHAPALFDDELVACARVARIGRTSLRFALELFRAGQAERALIGADLVYVNAEPGTRTPVPWSARLRERVRAFETLAPGDAHG